MLQHPTVWFDRKQSKYPSRKLFLHEFLHTKSTDVCKIVTNSACRLLYHKTSEKSSLVILEIGLISKLLRYVPLNSGTLCKLSFSTVWKLLKLSDKENLLKVALQVTKLGFSPTMMAGSILYAVSPFLIVPHEFFAQKLVRNDERWHHLSRMRSCDHIGDSKLWKGTPYAIEFKERPLEAFLVIFGRRALNFLFESSWEIMKIDTTLCACAVVIILLVSYGLSKISNNFTATT